MKLLDDIDGDVKAIVLIVAILCGSLLCGFAIYSFLEHCTATEAISKGYENHYDALGRQIWTHPKPSAEKP